MDNKKKRSILWRRDVRGNSLRDGPRQEQLSNKENQPTWFVFCKKVTVRTGMPVTAGFHVTFPFFKNGIANLGVRIRLSIPKRHGTKKKKLHNLVVVTNTFDYTKKRIKSLL